MISGCGVGERVVTLVNLNAGGEDIRFAVLENRNFRAIFDIKVDCRYGVEASRESQLSIFARWVVRPQI